MAESGKIWIGFERGIEQSHDEAALPGEILLVAENCIRERGGAVVKRHGLSRVSRLQQLADETGSSEFLPGDGARGIFSTGYEPVILGKHRLYGFGDIPNRWYDRGPVSPCTHFPGLGFVDGWNYKSCDIEQRDGYILHCAARSRDDNDNSVVNDIWDVTYFITDENGAAVVPQAYSSGLETTTTADKPWGVRATSCDDHLVMLYMTNSGSGAKTLKCQFWNTVTHSPDGMGAPVTISTDVKAASSEEGGFKQYDACPWVDGLWLNCYILESDNTKAILEGRNQNGTVVFTGLINAVYSTAHTFYAVSVCHDPKNEAAYVLAYCDVDELGASVLLFKFERQAATWTNSWAGPTTMGSLGGAPTFAHRNLGVGVSPDVGRVTCVWSEVEFANSANNHFVTRNRSTDLDGGNLDSAWPMYNMFPMSKPFWKDGRCYLLVSSSVGSGIYDSSNIHDLAGQDLQTEAFDCNAVVDLWVNEVLPFATTRNHTVAAAFDIGLGVPMSSFVLAGVHGPGANVTELRDGRIGFGVPRLAYSLRNQEQNYDAIAHYLDFDALPGASRVFDGTLVVAGGFTTWYDGAFATELGFILPPVTFSITELASQASGFPTAGVKYQYVPCWFYEDRSGTLHRGVPGPPAQVETTGTGPFREELVAKSNHISNRPGLVESALYWFRADLDANYKRISGPSSFALNPMAGLTVKVVDKDNARGPLLYSQPGGGEIEAVHPEPCISTFVCNGRVWFVRDSGVQYSKNTTPGTEVTQRLAPETNEGFQFLFDEGEHGRGGAALDEKAILFTDRSIFVVAGEGPDPGGFAGFFSPPTKVESDTGCTHPRSVVSTPEGVLFRGKRGFYQLGRDLAVQPIGMSVIDITDKYPEVTSATLLPKKNLVVFTLTDSAREKGTVLVYDYLWKSWFEWTVGRVFVGSCNHNDHLLFVEANHQVWAYDESTWMDDGLTYYEQRVRTGYAQVAGKGGLQRLQEIVPFVDELDKCDLNVTLFRDYEPAWDKTLSEPGKRSQHGLIPRAQLGQAHSVMLSDRKNNNSITGRGLRMLGVMLSVVPKRGTAQVRRKK